MYPLLSGEPTMIRSFALVGALVAALLTSQVQAEVPVPVESPEQSTQTQDILTRIRALPGVVSAVELANRRGIRFFSIAFDQPVDHAHPEGRRFRQRVTLVHRNESRPMVLASSGYGIPIVPVQYEVTYFLQGNQLLLEHRFFGPSTPQPATWEHLTIEQSAADTHRIVEAFKTIYGAKWVSTGYSKGGMTSVYHRYFYPNDVDATVPFVAPTSQGPYDVRYVKFIEEAGDDPTCYEKLKTFQRAALQRRAELLPFIPATYGPQGVTFNLIGEERAFEFAVVELPFSFWQYGTQEMCDYIPAADAPAWELFDFIEYVVGIGILSADEDLEYYAAYYYQAATQLGSYRVDERHLHGLLRYPREYRAVNYPPLGVEKTFDHSIMNQVERWVRNEGERILFIYGENDPWSAGAYDVRPSNDSYVLWVPGGNHGANIPSLPDAEYSLALNKLEEWMGSPVIRSTARMLEAEDLPIYEPGREALFLR
jgi:hypothetical protein